MAYSLMQMANAFIRAGELADALDALNQQLEAQPDDQAARRLRIQVLARLPGDDNLRAALDDSRQLSSRTADDLVRESILWQGLGDWPAAQAAMEQARMLDPNDERIIERLLLTLEKSNQLDAARALVDSLPSTWRWLQYAGDLAALVGDDAAAGAHYAGALAHLEQKMDTAGNAFAASLKSVLEAKRARYFGLLKTQK